LKKLDKLIEETEEERTTEGVYWIDDIINEVNTNIDVLDVATRGFLEKTIDEAKAAIPDRLIEARELTKVMFIQNSEDYTLGWAVGYVVGAFISFFTAAYLRRPNEQQLKEVHEVINNRAAELRRTIFKTG
jgi:hypothetical protein